jgi:hypothetical protein
VKRGHGKRCAPYFLEGILARPAQEKADSKAARLRAAEEVEQRRRQQLGSVEFLAAKIKNDLQAARNDGRRYGELQSHLSGFYQEIDKLAKGKGMLEATELVIDQANDIVRDAKGLIKGDTYLDLVKEFVPAGDNQVYSDVLVKLRTVQQAVSRCEPEIKNHEMRLGRALRETNTISGALHLHLDGNQIPSKEEVEESLDGETLADSWFYEGEDGGEYFDFDLLDRRDLEKYFLSGREAEDNEE